MAEARTLKLDFVVKKWQNQKILFGLLIYALYRFQNQKHPVGRIDTLMNEIEVEIECFTGGLCEKVCSTGQSCRKFGTYVCVCPTGKKGKDCKETGRRNM